MRRIVRENEENDENGAIRACSQYDGYIAAHLHPEPLKYRWRREGATRVARNPEKWAAAG